MSNHYYYKGHCSCGRRHTYSGDGVYIPNTDYLKLDKPFKCDGCGDLNYILDFTDNDKTFRSQDTAKDTVYLHEMREVPRIHQGLVYGKTPQAGRQSYWLVSDSREAEAIHLQEQYKDYDGDQMQKAPLPTEPKRRLSRHPVLELAGIAVVVIIGVAIATSGNPALLLLALAAVPIVALLGT